MHLNADHSAHGHSDRKRERWAFGLLRGLRQCFSLSRMNERALWGWTTTIEVRTLDLLLFFIHWKALSYGFISFSASCILNIEWNANVTFKLSEGHWKWTAMSGEYLVWIGEVVRREKVITSKGNLTEEEEGKKRTE